MITTEGTAPRELDTTEMRAVAGGGGAYIFFDGVKGESAEAAAASSHRRVLPIRLMPR